MTIIMEIEALVLHNGISQMRGINRAPAHYVELGPTYARYLSQRQSQALHNCRWGLRLGVSHRPPRHKECSPKLDISRRHNREMPFGLSRFLIEETTGLVLDSGIP